MRVLGLASILLLPAAALAQGTFPGMAGHYAPNAPKLPWVELAGPLDTALARVLLKLSDDQATRYAVAYDSFMVTTRPQRDSATALLGKMNDRLDQGDRAAAEFYAEQVQDIGKGLKDRQDRWENNLRHLLTGDQVNAYKKWREGEDQAAERKRREDALRWQEAAFRGPYNGPRTTATPEIKTALASPPDVAAPALGSQSVLVGRTLYVTAQLGIDSAGTLAARDLRTQAIRAFANLTTVLRAAGASAKDVSTLTIYVVNYGDSDIATIRDAGAAFFGGNAPAVTVLGVQSLSREGALIAISATAMASGPVITQQPRPR